MNGKNISIKVFVTGENLEKLDRIRDYLNSQNDVQSGDVEQWTQKDVYTLLFNDAISDFTL